MEHPFGTIKRSLGWDHYLVRGKEKVSGAYGFDWALIMFCYNFKRVLNMIWSGLAIHGYAILTTGVKKIKPLFLAFNQKG